MNTATATTTHTNFPACGVQPEAMNFMARDRKRDRFGAVTYPGMSFMRFEVDHPIASGGAMAETSETDNTLIREMTDLSIGVASESVSFSPDSRYEPGSPAAGLPYTLYANYDVDGDMPYPAFQIKRVINLAPGQGALNAVCKAAVAAMNPTSSYFFSPGKPSHDPSGYGYGSRASSPIGDVTFPSCGRAYYVDVCLTLDAGNCVGEPFEANNGGSGNPKDCKRLRIHEPKPDLTVWHDVRFTQFTDLELSATTGGPAGPCVDVPLNTNPSGVQFSTPCAGIKAIVTNIGEATATGIQTILYQQPGNTPISSGSPNNFSLSPNGKQEVLFNRWLPSSGNYYLEVKSDPFNTIIEFNEQNNKSQREIPELELNGISVK